MGLLRSVFKFIDPILDKLDPMHNKVQTWTTGQKTTAGQAPYFEKIAPVILDVFLPGVGSAVGAADAGSNGNWTGAIVYAGAAYAQGFGAGTAAAGNSTAGYAAGDLGSGITASTTNGVGVGLANAGADTLGSGISGTVNSGFSFGTSAASGAAAISNATVIGFDNTDLGTGLTGISYDEAARVGAQPLTAGAIRSGLKYAKYGIDVYNMRTASGDILATFGNHNMNGITPSQYLYSAPADLSAIPSNRAADLNGAALASAAAAAQEDRNNKILISIGAAFLVYYFAKGKK